MAGLKELAHLMLTLEAHVEACTRCGACQAVCPVYEQTGNEADVARGKLAILEGLIQEMFDNPRGVVKRLDRCLLCGSCENICSGGVSTQEIFFKARTIISGYTGLSRTQKLIFRHFLSRPEFFDKAFEWIGHFQTLFFKPADNLQGTSCPRFITPLPAGRHISPPAVIPFHRMISPMNTSPGISKIKAAFFVGCLIDKIYPQIAVDTVDILNHHDIGILLPENQACCGIPAISAGDIETFNSLVSHTLEKFDPNGYDFLITACATCTYTIKKIWPMMFQSDSEEKKAKLEMISQKTVDIHEFLVREIGIHAEKSQPENDAALTTYHDPCHLKKSLGISEEPRTLIMANQGNRFIEMPESDRCCGFGGSFSIKHYDLSKKIGFRKIDNIMSTGCSILATGCPACMIQISDMLSASDKKIKVKHSIEIYAAKIRAEKTNTV